MLFSFFSFQVIGVISKDIIPKGTRFGPLVGEIYTSDTVPKDANRKYFWRVSKTKHSNINQDGQFDAVSVVSESHTEGQRQEENEGERSKMAELLFAARKGYS